MRKKASAATNSGRLCNYPMQPPRSKEGVRIQYSTPPAATICYEAGLDIKSAATLLGDTEQVTGAVYQELREKRHFSSVEMVNAYLAMRDQQSANA